MDEPLIWTSKGNLPIADLAYSYRWEDGPEATVFIEEYRLGEEIVKNNVHALSKFGVTGQAVIGVN